MGRSSGKSRKMVFVRILLIICVVLLLTISIAVYFLKRGVSIDSLSVGGIVVSEFSLIWKEKLELQVSEITAAQVEKSPKKTSDTNFVRRGIQAAHYLARFFSRFSIVDSSAFLPRNQLKKKPKKGSPIN